MLVYTQRNHQVTVLPFASSRWRWPCVEELPHSAIHHRWSLRAAAEIYEDIDDEISGILPVLNTAKLKHRRKGSEGIAPLKKSAYLKQRKKDVPYVQLRRNEKAGLPPSFFITSYWFPTTYIASL